MIHVSRGVEASDVRLREENDRLKVLLAQCQAKLQEATHKKKSEQHGSLAPKDLNSASKDLWESFNSLNSLSKKPSTYPSLRDNSEQQQNKSGLYPLLSSSSSSSSSQSSAVIAVGQGVTSSRKDQDKIYASGMSAKRFIDGDDSKCAIFLCANSIPKEKGDGEPDVDVDESSLDDDDEAYVCVMDVNNDDFWVIVNPEEEDLAPVREDLPIPDDQAYEFVDEQGLISAMADFVTLALKKYPEAKRLEDYRLKKMLDGTLYEFAELTNVGKVYKYGAMAYTGYAYGSWVFSLYSDPAMVKMVASGVITAGSWALMLFR